MCGIVGVVGSKQAARHVVNGLQGIQNRGHGSCGVAGFTSPAYEPLLQRGTGLVIERFPSFFFEEGHRSHLWEYSETVIGHVRYPTTGSETNSNAAPFLIQSPWEHGRWIAVCHNGDIPDIIGASKDIRERGYVPQSTCDGEILGAYLCWYHAQFNRDWLAAIRAFQEEVKAAYALSFLTDQGEVYLCRDPYGIRPLSLGMLDGATVFASESAAYGMMGAHFPNDAILGPGEIVRLLPGVLERHQGVKKGNCLCGFELAYVMNPESQPFGPQGISVQEFRRRIGARIARLDPFPGVQLDAVCGVPNSGLDYADGYCEARAIPSQSGVNRRPYYHFRTFQQTSELAREAGAQRKFWIDQSVREKTILVLEDSIVRGRVSRVVTRKLKAAGARAVYVASGFPPFQHPCFYGIDAREKLIASASKSFRQIKEEIGADGLYFIPLGEWREEYLRASQSSDSPCLACATGHYPLEIPLTDQVTNLTSHEGDFTEQDVHCVGAGIGITE